MGSALGSLHSFGKVRIAKAFYPWPSKQFQNGVLPETSVYARLAMLLITGGSAYLGLLFVMARETLEELVKLIIRRRIDDPDPPDGEALAARR